MVQPLLVNTCFDPNFVLPPVVAAYHDEYRADLASARETSFFQSDDRSQLRTMAQEGRSIADIADFHAHAIGRYDKFGIVVHPALKEGLRKSYLESLTERHCLESATTLYFQPHRERVIQELRRHLKGEDITLDRAPLPPKRMQKILRMQFGPAAPILCFCPRPVKGIHLGLMHELDFHPLIMGLDMSQIDDDDLPPNEALNHDYDHLLDWLPRMQHWEVVALSMLRRHVGDEYDKIIQSSFLKPVEELSFIKGKDLSDRVALLLGPFLHPSYQTRIQVAEAYLADLKEYRRKLDQSGWQEPYAREMDKIEKAVLNSIQDAQKFLAFGEKIFSPPRHTAVNEK